MMGQSICLARGLIALAVLVGVVLAGPDPASAAFGIRDFLAELDQPADSSTPPVPAEGAATHPDLTLGFDLRTSSVNVADEGASGFAVDLPAGLLGDPTAVEQCTEKQFDSSASCGAGSQVGFVDLTVNDNYRDDPAHVTLLLGGGAPVFNLERRKPTETARLGFKVPGLTNAKVNVVVAPRTEGDYGLQARLEGVPRAYQLLRVRMSLWGVPSDSVHDPDRFDTNARDGGNLRPNPGTPRKAFLSAPTRCGSPLTTTISGQSYEKPNVAVSASYAQAGLVGCDLVPFAPSLSVLPVGPARADAPGAFEARVAVPQSQSADIRSSSHLERAEIRLPPSLNISPAVANGLIACDDMQLHLDSRDAPSCPDGSSIGSAEVDVPVLGTTLKGALFVRPQTADETYRVVLTASGVGVNAKIPGVVRPDPVSGQLTAIFDQTPQVPFSEIRVHLDGGPQGVLATGLSCETSAASGLLTPWSGTGTVGVSSPGFSTSGDGAGGGCPSGTVFSPSVSAGSLSAASGRTSPFSLRLQRSDRSQELGALTTVLPPGLTAIVRGVPLCDLGRAAAGTCGRESQIGSITTGAGAGTSPFFVGGKAFLTRGYKGGAYGMSFVIPVVAGPFNLGTVVVQAAVRVDPVTAQLTVASDPFPRIVKGVPLRIRDVRVNVDRPRFTLNPTNCKQLFTNSRVTALQGASVLVKSPFQASGCSRQAYKPKITLALKGRGQTTDGKHPGLTAAVSPPKASANISKVRAVLPSSLALDPDNAQALCKYEDGQKVDCPKSSIVGRAKITTPLLNKPLRGPVYFVENQRRNKFGRIVKTLPTLLLTLRGEVALNIRAKTAVAGGKNLVTTFSGLPDQPFSRFDLALDGGKNGILAANTNLCKAKQVAEFDTDGQNGKHHDPDVTLSTPCRN